jgi:predicted ATPase/DNA-binding SARP family transcriptional activator
MEMLEIRLIGTFAVECDGRPITISSRIAQSLFAYLILNAGTSHRREKLAGMFWPDTTEEKARAYLRHELWRIRKALSPQSKVNYLTADDINISFNSTAEHWVDVNALENLSETASIEELTDALSVSQGDFLPGFYDEWIVMEREHLRSIYEQKMAWLLELLESQKRWPEIFEWAECWISLGQGPEAAYRYLMIAHDALGDRAKVASTYERCKQALRELDLEPSEQTRALAFKRTSKLNIPIPLTSFIGREKELKEVLDLFSKSRLITLTGSGGVGKTRLAIQVVADVLDRFPDGVWFLDLAPVSDPALVPNTLANLLGLREPGDTKLSITDLLINYFRSRAALVIFDNCEHLIESCAQLVNSLLTSCENLSILATSREALRVSGEIPYRVPSLLLPSDFRSANEQRDFGSLAQYESVQLFVERASTLSGDFKLTSQNAAAIVQICQRLDGIPLAIELAVARVNALTVEQISKRLDDRFNLLRSGLRTAMPRHQTLRATIEWSYDLLSEKECILFRRLAAFMGGWTPEAAEEVCSGSEIESSDVLDLLSQLANKSLVLVETSDEGEARYRFLETIRQYAHEKLLEAGGGEEIRDKHLLYFVKLVEQAGPELYRSNQVFWLNKLDDELENFRLALEWALATDVESGLYLIVSARFFWEARGDFREVGDWLAQFLEHHRAADSLRAQALVIYAYVLADRGVFAEAQRIANQSLEISRAISDKQAEALSLWGLGMSIGAQGDARQGILFIEQSQALYESLGDKLGQAIALEWLSIDRNDRERGKAYIVESLRLYRELGHLSGIAMCLMDLAALMIDTGDFSSVKPLLEESRMMYRQLGNQAMETWILFLYGRLAFWQGDYQRANTYFEQCITLYEKVGVSWSFWVRIQMAYVFLRQGDIVQARETFEISLRQVQSENGLIYAIEGIASLHVNQRQHERGARLYAWADARRDKIGDRRPGMEQADFERDLAVIHAKLEEAEFAKFSAEGRAMTVEQAIEFALNTMDEM